MKEILIILTCWILVTSISEIFFIKFSKDIKEIYNIENLTKLGGVFILRSLTGWTIIKKLIEYLIALFIWFIIWSWKIVRIPIRIIGWGCKKVVKKEEIDQVDI